MANTGVTSLGTLSYGLPGVYSEVNANQLNFNGSTNQQPLVIIGTSNGGSNSVNKVTQSNTKATYVSGDVLEAINFAEKAGATNIYTIITNPLTPSYLNLASASGVSGKLTAINGGVQTNSFSVSIQGSPGDITATFNDPVDNISQTQSGLGPVYDLQYTGNGTTATYAIVHSLPAPTVTLTGGTGGALASGETVNVIVVAKNAANIGAASTAQTYTATASGASVAVAITAVTGATIYDIYASSATNQEEYLASTTSTSYTIDSLTALVSGAYVPAQVSGADFVAQISGQTDGSQSIDLAIGTGTNYPYVSDLALYLASQIGYSVTNTASLASVIPAEQMDDGSASILTAQTLTSNNGSVFAFFNSLGVITATVSSATASAPAPTNGNVYFIGGSTGTATSTNWISAFNLLKTMIPSPVYIVALTSSLTNLQVLSSTVKSLASSGSQRLTRAYVGGSTAVTESDMLALSYGINNDRILQAGPDFYGYGVNGNYNNFPAYQLAVIAAAMRASVDPAIPLTNKILPSVVSKLNGTFDGNTVAALNQGGVAMATVNNAGETIWSLGCTTDINPKDKNNVYYVEESVGASVDRALLYLKNTISSPRNGLIGTGNYGQNSLKGIVSKYNSELQKETATFKWLAGYVPVTETSIQQLSSTTFLVPLVLYVASPINGIISTVSLQLPLSLT